MKVATTPEELGQGRRAVAVGTFDGVHLGHRRVLETARAAGLTSTVVTFDPHPRTALGNRVELLTTRERRLELLADAAGIGSSISPRRASRRSSSSSGFGASCASTTSPSGSPVEVVAVRSISVT